MTVAIVYPEESYRLMGACFEVYKEMGCGFLEPVYQECLEIELALQNIPFKPQDSLKLSYKGRLLKQVYEPDFVCWEKIVVELKAVKAFDDVHRASGPQLLEGHGLQTWFTCELRPPPESRIRTDRRLIFTSTGRVFRGSL